MDREEALKRIMSGYDDVWTKAIQAKRAAKSGQGATEAAEKPPVDGEEERDPSEREPDNDPDDGMDEETKAQLLELLSQ